MSNDVVVGFILGVATMFLGTGLVPIMGGRRGQVFSFLLFFALLILAWEWPNVQGHIAAPLNAFLVRVASNGYVWLGMLAVTWLYLAVDSLFAPYRGVRPTRTKLSALDKLINFVIPKPPESLASDREYLIKELSVWGGRKFQMFCGPSDRCVRLVDELGEILKAAKWEPVNTPMPILADAKVRRGISIRSSSTSPSVEPSLALHVVLTNIGIRSSLRQTPDLRQFDYCFVYIAE
jgi:hypothetical protein